MDKKAQRILAGFTCAAFVIVAFFSLFSSQKRPITTAQDRIALSAPAFIGPNKH